MSGPTPPAVPGPTRSVTRPSAQSALIGIGALCVLGAALRAAGLRSDFWLDEVWSWQLARELASGAGVFTDLHHSNNHHLLTLWMYGLGDAAPVWAYRLPSLLAGMASVPLAAALAWPRGRLEALLAATGVATSFALVHFASEARGYALAVALALGAQLLLRRALGPGGGRGGAALGFATCVGLGLLAHLGFVFYWAGALVQSLWDTRGAPAADRLRLLLLLHGAPLLALGLLWVVDLRFLFVGAGNPTDLVALAARCLGFGFGPPVERALALPGLLLLAAVLVAAARVRARGGDASWIGDAVTIAGAPLLVFAIARPEVIALRYFLVGIAFAWILLADLLAAGLRRGGLPALAAGAALALALLGSAFHHAEFFRNGRGGFHATLQIMLEADASPVLRVASDHDFRNGMVLRFHARDLPPGRRLDYVTRDRLDRTAPGWWILHRPERPERVPQRIRDAQGRSYERVHEFDHGAISGFYWALYRAATSRSSTTVPKPPAPKGSAP